MEYKDMSREYCELFYHILEEEKKRLLKLGDNRSGRDEMRLLIINKMIKEMECNNDN